MSLTVRHDISTRFRCGNCRHTWRIDEAPTRSHWHCPWCGERQAMSQAQEERAQVHKSHCLECGRAFYGAKRDAMWCSKRCSQRHYRRRQREARS